MTLSVLVTGATGFVGRALVHLLSQRGHRVTGLDLVAPGESLQLGEHGRFLKCDLLDDAALKGPQETFDVIVHLAGVLPSNASCRELFAVNVGGTAAVLEHLATRARHLVLFSTGLVYGPQPGPFNERMACQPACAYGRSKLAAEALVEAWGNATGSQVTLLRPSVLYGPGAPKTMLLYSLMTALHRQEAFAMTAGEQLRDFLHVDDAVRAVVAVVEQRAPGVFNLASGQSQMVRDAALLVAQIANRPELLRIGQLPYRDGEVFDYRFDISALSAAIGWHPQVTLTAGFEQLWRAMT